MDTISQQLRKTKMICFLIAICTVSWKMSQKKKQQKSNFKNKMVEEFNSIKRKNGNAWLGYYHQSTNLFR